MQLISRESFVSAVRSRILQLALGNSSRQQYFEQLVDYSLLGGKGLRAQLVFAGHQLVSHSSCADLPSSLIDLAAAVEIFQASALVHDDIADRSSLRRGRPCLYIEAQNILDREVEEGGKNLAVFIGDFLEAKAIQIAGSCTTYTGRSIEISEVFAEMVADVAYGQFLDEYYAHSDLKQLTPEIAEDIMRHKTAGYSVAYPVVLGAILAGLGRKPARVLFESLLPLGIAFQMRDDLIDLVGSASETGKIGTDVTNLKRTFTLSKAIELSGVQPDRLTDMTEQQVRDLINSSGAVSFTESSIASYLHSSLESVSEQFGHNAELLLQLSSDIASRTK